MLGSSALSLLRLHELASLAESKPVLKQAGERPNKLKVLHRWLYILVGGPEPSTLSDGYNKALMQRIFRACQLGGRRAVAARANLKGPENREARERHLRAWEEAWAQEEFPHRGMECGEVLARSFARAGEVQEAAAQQVPRVLLRLRTPLGESQAPVSSSSSNSGNTVAAAAAVLQALHQQPKAEASAPKLAKELEKARGLLAVEVQHAACLQQEKGRLEEELAGTRLAAAQTEQRLRRELRASQSELHATQRGLAAAEEEATAAAAGAAAAAALKCQRLQSQLREVRAVNGAQLQREMSMLALDREHDLRRRELEKARLQLQEERDKRQEFSKRAADAEVERAKVEELLRAAQRENVAVCEAKAAAVEKSAAEAERVQLERGARLAHEVARSRRLNKELKEAQAVAARLAGLELELMSIKGAYDSRGLELEQARAELERARDTSTAAAALEGGLQSEILALRQQLSDLKQDLHGHRIAAGREEAKKRHEEAARELAASRAPSQRRLSRSLQKEREQRALLLDTREELIEKIRELEEQQEQHNGRGKRPHGQQLPQLEVHPLKGGESAGIDGWASEIFRRLVEECGIPFSAVPTANLLVLCLHMRTVPPKDMLFTEASVRKAFKKLGVYDAMKLYERNKGAPASTPWAPAADAGNAHFS